MDFMGYTRENGSVGTRNLVVVLPTIGCANEIAWRIAKSAPDAVALTHNHACIRVGKDAGRAKRTLIGIGKNPNVHSVLVVGLGCEAYKASDLAAEIVLARKPVRQVSLDDYGTYEKLVDAGIAMLGDLLAEAGRTRRVSCKISDLTIGIKCGGSGTVSAIASNPAVGRAADLIVQNGGRVIFTETAELIGADRVLARRACCPEVGARLLEAVQSMKDEIKRFNVDILGSEPTQGNIKSGLTTIEEKSLGAIIKSGTTPLRGVLDYAHEPEGPGLYFMDGTTQASQLMLGMAAAGAQVHLFSYGGGLPARFRGLPSYPPGIRILPVLKVLGSCDDEDEQEHFDLYAGGILRGTESIKEAGDRLFRLILETASGAVTYTEKQSDYTEMLQLYADGLLM
jgi:altronate dehydratase large subunit